RRTPGGAGPIRAPADGLRVGARRLLGGPPRPGRPPELGDVDVDQEAIPEALEEVEHEALPAVEEPEPEHVPVAKVKEGPDVERQLTPPGLEPAGPLVGRPTPPQMPRMPQMPQMKDPRRLQARPLDLLAGLELGVAG